MGCFSGIFCCTGGRCGRSERRTRNEDSKALAEYAAGAPDKKAAQRNPASPGLVARLMGLDSMPIFPCNTPTSSLSRSRSTGSLNSWPVQILSSDRSRVCPLMKISQSFREVPTFLKENEEFLLLSFDENVGPTAREKMKAAKPKEISSKISAPGEVRSREISRKKTISEGGLERKLLEEKKAERLRKHAIEKKPRSNRSRSRSRRMRESAETFAKQKQRAEKKTRATSYNSQPHEDDELQNSSPDSVLDSPFESEPNFIVLRCSLISESKKQIGSSRKKLSSRDDEPISSPPASSPPVGPGRRNRCDRATKEVEEAGGDCFSEAWTLSCKLCEIDAKESTWFSKENLRTEEVSEVAKETTLDIFESLLHEMVVELFLCRHLWWM